MSVMKPQQMVDAQVEPLSQGELLYRITARIHDSLELEEILAVTVAEVRDFLGTDRVKVYRFCADGHGEVIAESIQGDRLPSLMGLHFPADDIPIEARELFVKARQRSIVDIATQQIGFSPLRGLHGLLDPEDVRYRPVDPCHVAYLTAMGVKSSLVVPLVHQEKLWGLMVSHHSEPRQFIEEDLKILQLVADQVCVAIDHALLLSQVRDRAAQEACVNRVSALLHTLPALELQAALTETVSALQGSGGRIYCVSQQPFASQQPSMAEPPEPLDMLFRWGQQPNLTLFDCPIEQHPLWQVTFPSAQREVLWAISDLYKVPQLRVLAPAFQDTAIRGLLVIPLRYHQQFLGYLTIFRDEIETETLWAGEINTDRRQIQPRTSFSAWREAKKGQAAEWSEAALDLAQTLGSHFAMAVEQFQLYQQVQRLNASLEGQVQERTGQLQRSLERSNLLKQVTDQIRRTLDSQVVLQTIVRELRNLLDTDRMLVYQFISDRVGEVTVEELRGNWRSVLGLRSPPNCFPHDYAQTVTTRAISHVATAALSPCHRHFLESIQVQANLVVPIRIGTQLWGLLIAHECRAPRVWEETEIELLQQLSAQAAIALQQAELYEQSCTVAATATAQAQQLQQLTEQLTHALHDLRHTQSQLVQTEKMSSLGQLVAGVAHEINNPINFIYGNLSYTEAYTQSLLDLVTVYQKQYPTPTPTVQQALVTADLDFLSSDFPKLLASMRIGADRIRQIVQSLRNFSRLDEAAKKPVNIHEGIDSTLMILQHRLKPCSNHRGILVVKDYGNLPLVECYAGQLNQVFMNILTNAIDALAPSEADPDPLPIPQITIHTTVESPPHQPRQVMVRIVDNGSGMTEAVRSHLFEPFFTTKPVGQGTGLGLSISYQIVEQHGGTIECVSQPGLGSEFRIRLPLLET